MTALPDLLEPASSDRHVEFPPELWGFGGAHGGLVMAVLVRAMKPPCPTGRSGR